MQIEDHRQIPPTLTGPDVTDVASPFLVRLICFEVAIQQVRGDVERMIAVCGRFELARSFNGNQSARRPVKCVFQSSKIFEHGGPFRDLLDANPADAEQDERLRKSGRLIAFEFGDKTWSNKPLTAFYDWIYIKALIADADCSAAVLRYSGFSDITFNPAKSLSCQAYAVALYVALHRRNLLRWALSSPDAFLETLNSTPKPAFKQPVQLPLI